MFFFEYGSKLDETWSKSYRVGRFGATGRGPRAKFGEQLPKNQKHTNKKIKQGQDPQTLEITLQRREKPTQSLNMPEQTVNFN